MSFIISIPVVPQNFRFFAFEPIDFSPDFFFTEQN